MHLLTGGKGLKMCQNRRMIANTCIFDHLLALSQKTYTCKGAAPPSFTFQGNFYNVSTSASSTGHYTVAIRYNNIAAVKAAATSQTPPQLLQWNRSNWLNITTSLDTTNQVITGVASSLSTFVIATSADSTPPTTTITPSGKLGNNNWYKSNVSITLTAADNNRAGNTLSSGTITIQPGQTAPLASGTSLRG
jgi:hypothetical protein